MDNHEDDSKKKPYKVSIEKIPGNDFSLVLQLCQIFEELNFNIYDQRSQ